MQFICSLEAALLNYLYTLVLFVKVVTSDFLKIYVL